MRGWVHTVKYEGSFFWTSTSRIICVLPGFIEATSRSHRVLCPPGPKLVILGNVLRAQIRHRVNPLFYDVLSNATLSLYSKIRGLVFLNIDIAYHMCFTRVSWCDVEITPCFTIPTPVRTSKGAPKGPQNEPWDQKSPKWVPGPPRVRTWCHIRHPNGSKRGRFEAQNRTRNRVGFRSWKSSPHWRPKARQVDPRDLENQSNPLEG